MNHIHGIVKETIEKHLPTIDLLNWKLIALNLGLVTGTKEEAVQHTVSVLMEILRVHCPPDPRADGLPLLNHTHPVFWNNTYLKKLVEEVNDQLHMINLWFTHKRDSVEGKNLQEQSSDQINIQIQIQTQNPDQDSAPKEFQNSDKLCSCGGECLMVPRPTNSVDWCVGRALIQMDPLHEVEDVLLTAFIVNNEPREIIVSENLKRQLEASADFIIEVRCLAKENPVFEHQWPESGWCGVNDKICEEFVPLYQKSSLKRRRDLKLSIPPQDLVVGSNKFYLFSKLADGVGHERSRTKTSPPLTYFAGVYLIRKREPKELIHQIKNTSRRTVEECANLNRASFLKDEVQVEKVTLPVTCIYDMKTLQTPAKGKNCKHLGCFSLENFVAVWKQSSERKWSCPLCGEKANELVVDELWVEILQKFGQGTLSKDRETQETQVEFYSNGEYQILFRTGQKELAGLLSPGNEDTGRDVIHVETDDDSDDHPTNQNPLPNYPVNGKKRLGLLNLPPCLKKIRT